MTPRTNQLLTTCDDSRVTISVRSAPEGLGNRAALVSLVCLVPLLIFSFLVNLPALPVRIFDEARNANNALEMYLHHSWIVPTYDGAPEMWNTKPPLLLWSQVAAMHVVGVGVLGLRLPAALSSLATGILLWAFCTRGLQRPWSGLCAGAVLATTLAYVVNHAGRTGDYDAMLAAFLTTYSLAAFTYATSGNRKWIAVFWIAASLSAMTKGIAGLLLFPAAVAIVMVERRLGRLLREPATYAGVLWFLTVVGGYYLLREHANPGYLKAVFGNEIGGRYVEGLGTARGPFLAYVDVIRARDPYWAYFLVPAFVVPLVAGNRRIRRVTLFNLIVVISFWLTISYGQTKLEWYALPLYPFFALQIGILLGAVWERIVPRLHSANIRHAAAVIAFVVVFYAPFAQIVPSVLQAEDDPRNVLQAQAQFLHRAVQEHADLRKYVFCFRGYNAPANFYIKLLRAQGVYVEARDRATDLSPGTHVVASQFDVRDQLEDVYDVAGLGERFGCAVYTVLGPSRAEESADHLRVLRATYGANCKAAPGNATTILQSACDGRSRCSFQVEVAELGDPAPGCSKEFEVEWHCDGSDETRTFTALAEAGFGSVVRLACGPAPRR